MNVTNSPVRALSVGPDAPLNGQPVPFPATTGAAASRVYVSDADGSMWRYDLSSSSASSWTVGLAWDAYSGSTYDAGLPIAMPPVVSVDSSGNSVLLFSTGDQENFLTGTGGTHVWSITDKPNSNGKWTTTPNWYLPFSGGKRVTGGISLFNSVAYFATYTPSSASVCSDGNPSIYGVDFASRSSSGDFTSVIARYPSPTTPGAFVSSVDLATGAPIFGLSVMQTPSCITTSSNPSDPYVGSSSVAVTSATSGSYQLVYQTGKSGGSIATNGKTSTNAVALSSPTLTTRLDSWASVFE